MKNYKLNILFFYVHPAKFHLFKNTIALLEKNGHSVDILISNKDVLADLLKSANINFTNLFPNGRKFSFLPNKLNAIVGLIRTLLKLWKHTRKNKYDVYVTDDVLSILGRLQGVPSIAFTDNDLSTVPLVKLIFKAADKIIAPASTSLDELEYKKIPFKGNKAIAHLSPKYFTKSNETLKKYEISEKEIIIIRLAKLNANHDIHGNPGITDNDLETLVKIIPNKYTIIISSERSIPEKFQKFRMNISAQDFTQILAHSSFFIGDSGTMATEAAVLGIPNILINNIAKFCGVHVELKEKYNLQYYFDTFSASLKTLNVLIEDVTIKDTFKERNKIFIDDSDDFNLILLNSIINNSKHEQKGN